MNIYLHKVAGLPNTAEAIEVSLKYRSVEPLNRKPLEEGALERAESLRIDWEPVLYLALPDFDVDSVKHWNYTCSAACGSFSPHSL